MKQRKNYVGIDYMLHICLSNVKLKVKTNNNFMYFIDFWHRVVFFNINKNAKK